MFYLLISSCEMCLLCLTRAEYITIISIMVCMSLCDFVTGVLFGIALACEIWILVWNVEVDAYPVLNRLLLRRAKFAQSQYTCGIYWRYGNFYCTKAEFTQSIPTGGGPADDDHEVAMCEPSSHPLPFVNTRTDSPEL